MGKHVVLTVIGILIGLLALAWLRPNTSAGATFLLLMSVAIINALGTATAAALRLLKAKRGARP
jgi:hypothetical protein